MRLDPLKSLENIVKMEGINRKDGTEARLKALNNWISENIEELEVVQPIIKVNLTLEESDFVKYHLAFRLADQLMDNCVHVDEQTTKITAKIRGLKR